MRGSFNSSAVLNRSCPSLFTACRWFIPDSKESLLKMRDFKAVGIIPLGEKRPKMASVKEYSIVNWYCCCVLAMELAKCCEDLRRAPFFPQQYQNPVVILQGKPHKSEFRPSNARKRHPIKYAHIWPFFQYFGVDIFPIFFQYFSNIVRVRFFSGTIYGILWPNMAIFGSHFLGCHKMPQLHLWSILELQRNQTPPVSWNSKLLWASKIYNDWGQIRFEGVSPKLHRRKNGFRGFLSHII